MEKDLKDILLKDLCARLPYGVICNYDTIVPIVGKVKSYDKLRAISEFDNKPCFQFGSNRDIFDFDNVIPYLFPLSSMTEEQESEYHDNCDIGITEWGYKIYHDCVESIDWLNSHHFDYRGLIEKGLALDASGLNIY